MIRLQVYLPLKGRGESRHEPSQFRPRLRGPLSHALALSDESQRFVKAHSYAMETSKP